MIIGINGKIGSGKDTVGKIIQYLTLGDEFAKTNGDIIADLEHDGYCASKSKFQIKKFAGKLKQIASLLTSVPVEKFEDQEFKKQEMPEEWWYKNVYDAGWDKKWTKETINYPTHTSIESHIVKTTYRQFLQNLGTEAMRDGLHTNVWVNALFADYKEESTNVLKHEGYHLEDVYPNWIITDMRFPNEMEAVVAKGGITIRVTSPFIRFSDGSYRAKSKMMGDFDNEHPSETSLDKAKFDYEIINDGTIEDLIEKVREILINEKLL